MSEIVLDGVTFFEGWGVGVSTPGRFAIMKPPELVDAYVELLAHHQAANMVELGIREGGSTALMALAGRPSKLVAVEIADAAPALAQLIRTRDLADQVRTYFGVDQADRPRLQQIVETEFDAPLDLVVDDASHRYHATRASFEVLFPRLRPGGLYIIEDWRWQYRTASGVVQAMADPTSESFGRVEEQLMERSLIDAVLDDPTSEMAAAALRAEAEGRLTPRQQTRLDEARRTGRRVEELETEDDERPLAALPAELLLVRACHDDVVDEVTVGSHWTTIRRGAAELAPGWTVASGFDDRFGLLA